MKKKAKGKDIKKSIVLMLGFLIACLFLLNNLHDVQAIGVQSVCLRNGEVIKFSQCNSNIDDFVCESTTCQLCVNEIRTGVYCPESLNSCNEGGGSCKYLYEQQQNGSTEEKLPVITLFNPVNGYFQEEVGEIEFSFKVTDSSKLEVCKLILNGEAVASKSRPIYLSTQKLYYTTEPGDYTWKIECATREGAYNKIYTITSEIRTLSVGNFSEANGNGTDGTQSYDIILIAPENEYSTGGAQEISFSYTISYANLSEIQECSLVLNEDVVSSANEITSNENSFQYSVYPGSYTWKIGCKTSEKNLTSETRSFTINSPAPAGGGGGGGGGGCLTNWSCTEWSNCAGGNQTRTCSKEKNYCYAGKKPDETKNCTVEVSSSKESTLESEEAESETETSSENILQRGISGITGAVVGAFDINRVFIVVAFVIVIVFIVVMIYYFKKKV